LSTKNTTKLTVYLKGEIQSIEAITDRYMRQKFSIPSNNNIHSVMLARSNYKKTLNYSHDPGNELNKSVIQGSSFQSQFRNEHNNNS
jgi:hypothetical protein